MSSFDSLRDADCKTSRLVFARSMKKLKSDEEKKNEQYNHLYNNRVSK